MKLILPLTTFLLFSTILSAQTAFVGDRFGGRLWYHPTNFSVGSYSGHTVCGDSNQLYSWGGNEHGELGDRNWGHRYSPIKVPNMNQIYYYSAGYVAGAIKRDGTGWIWGNKIKYPTHVIDSVKYLDAGFHAVNFIKQDGTVWSVGQSYGGTFGDGQPSRYVTEPVKMIGIDNAVRVANGLHVTVVLLETGKVMVCGVNKTYGLQNNTPSNSLSLVPIELKGLSNIVAIASNKRSHLALDDKGNVFAWGLTPQGMYRELVQVDGLKNIVAISSRNDGAHFMALDSSGNCYTWGNNYKGCLGTGSGSSLKTPRLVATNVIDILAGESFSYIVKKDFSLWASGVNHGGSIYLGVKNFISYRFIQLDLDANGLGICHPDYADFSNYSEQEAEICDGETYHIKDRIFSKEGSYLDTFTNRFGFDSLVVTHLKIRRASDTISFNICSGDTLIYHNKSYSESGLYHDTILYNVRCKRSMRIAIHVKPKKDTTLKVAICDGDFFKVGRKKYTETGKFTDKLVSSIGCDSTVVTNLLVHPVYDILEERTLCSGDTLFLFNTFFTRQQTSKLTFKTTKGCDSIITLKLVVNPSETTDQAITKCNGTSITVGNNTYDSSGIYIDTLNTRFGCDSIVTTELNVNPSYHFTESYNICSSDSILWNDHSFKQPGTYRFLNKTNFGCDSNYTISIQVAPAHLITQNIELCPGSSVFVAKNKYSSSGRYKDVLTNSHGCDSIVLTNIRTHNEYYFDNTETICADDTLYAHNQHFTEVGNYITSFKSFWGCDSIYELVIDTFKDLRCHPTCFIPTAFSPNNDGINDVFGFTTNQVQNSTLRVYNRWGELIYNTSGLKPTWDGTYRNQMCNKGVYHYVVTTTNFDGNNKQYQGTVSLVR